jgi:hypothetical protein
MPAPTVTALAVAAGLAVPAAAQNLPPRNGLPLSQVVAAVEAAEPVQVFTEIEWDDDGYWDMEFINTSNRRTSVRIDPFTGGRWSRRR